MIKKVLGPLSFRIKLSDGRRVRRHVDHVRVRCPESKQQEHQAADDFLVGPELTEPRRELQPRENDPQPDAPVELPAPVSVRRSTRVRRQPDRLC